MDVNARFIIDANSGPGFDRVADFETLDEAVTAFDKMAAEHPELPLRLRRDRLVYRSQYNGSITILDPPRPLRAAP